MLKRQAATQACMDRFAFRPVEPGRRDCGKLAAHAMHQMGRSAKLLTGSRHKTFAGALRYVRGLGFSDLAALVDGMGLERIPPASARPGDLIGMPTDDGNGFGCSLAVALDNGRILGLNPSSGLIEPMIPHQFVAAWRL
jgi:hypothetical protein